MIAWVVLDCKKTSVNVLNERMALDFNRVMEELEGLVKSGKIFVAIIVSGKKNGFVAGADIHSLYPNTSREAAEQAARGAQDMFERVARLKVPTIAAIHGPALGGGLELALACTYRVCSDHRKTTMGLPEVKLGLLPGAGGTVRLPRVIGLQNALQVILPGGSLNPKKAFSQGLVDVVFPWDDKSPQFYAKVRSFAAKKFESHSRRQVLDPSSVGPLKDRVLNGTRLGRWIVGRMAAQGLDEQTKGKYPAPYLALDSILHGLSSPSHKAALRFEAEAFARLAVSPESKVLFFSCISLLPFSRLFFLS